MNWYHETKFVTETHQKYHARYSERFPARNSILSAFKKDNKHCSVEIVHRSRVLSKGTKLYETYLTYFNRYCTRST